MSWTIFKEVLGLNRWYLTESTYAWRAFTTYWIFHDWMIQKGVVGLRIISIRKTLSWTIFKEVLGLHRWYLTESTYAWRANTAYWIFHDWMIQKGVAGLRIISIKKLWRGPFSKKFLAYIVDTWLKVLMHEGLLLHTGLSMIEWSKRPWQNLK